MNHERIPVKLVGCGRGRDYLNNGISHWADDDKQIVATLPHIKQYHPASDEELARILPEFLHGSNPAYLNLTR